jgi:hypothetical protein
VGCVSAGRVVGCCSSSSSLPPSPSWTLLSCLCREIELLS